jgi:tetratricopeptide (TPR) repeat protein
LTKRETGNAEAYQAYLKGRYFWNKRTTANFSKATDYFQQAVDLDPGYAQAYVGLAHCYSFRAEWGNAKKQLEKALELDDTLAEAHAALAFVFRFCREWDFPGTEKEFKRAIELNPNYATGHQWYAYYLASMERFDEAIREINEAHDLDPLSINVNTDKGEILYFSRRYDEAMVAYRSSLEMDNNFMMAHYLLGCAYEEKGMYGEAADEYQKALALVKVDDYPNLTGYLGRAYALMGRRDEAVKILNELKKTFEVKAASAAKIQIPFAVALICAAVGDKDQAFVWLEKGIEYHGYEMIQAKMDPRYDSLRSDSRFTDLLRRVGLPS